MQFAACIAFVITIVGSVWERQAGRSDGAFRTVFSHYLGRYEPLAQLACSCNPLGLAADIAFAFSLYFVHRSITWLWRMFAMLWSQPIWAW